MYICSWFLELWCWNGFGILFILICIFQMLFYWIWWARYMLVILSQRHIWNLNNLSTVIGVFNCHGAGNWTWPMKEFLYVPAVRCRVSWGNHWWWLEWRVRFMVSIHVSFFSGLFMLVTSISSIVLVMSSISIPFPVSGCLSRLQNNQIWRFHCVPWHVRSTVSRSWPSPQDSASEIRKHPDPCAPPCVRCVQDLGKPPGRPLQPCVGH